MLCRAAVLVEIYLLFRQYLSYSLSRLSDGSDVFHFSYRRKTKSGTFPEVAFPTPQVKGRASLQPSFQEATELKTRIVELENAIKQLETEKAGLRKALSKLKQPFVTAEKLLAS